MGIDADPRYDVLCRFCVHALRRHAFAVARARLPGIQMATRPAAGSPLARLQALQDAEQRGLVTADEAEAARRRIFRRAYDG